MGLYRTVSFKNLYIKKREKVSLQCKKRIEEKQVSPGRVNKKLHEKDNGDLASTCENGDGQI